MIPSSARRALPLVALLAFAGELWAADPLPSSVTKALAATSRRAEVAMLEEACTTTTDPTMLPWVELYAGEARRLNGEPALARAHFERVAGDFPAHRAKNPAVLGMALVDAGGAASGNVLATLQLIADDNVPDTMNADRYLLVAQARAREGAPATDVAGLAQRAVKFAASDKEQSKRINKAVADLPSPEPAAAPPPVPSGPADQVAITQIRAAIASGDFPTASRLAAAFPTTYAGSPYLKEASYAGKRAAKGVRTDPKRVVVLLPLSGEYAQPGSALKAAIELAADRTKANVVMPSLF